MLDPRSLTSERNADPAARCHGLIDTDVMTDSVTCHSRESGNPEGFSNTPQPKPEGWQSLVVTHRSHFGWISMNLAHFDFFTLSSLLNRQTTSIIEHSG